MVIFYLMMFIEKYASAGNRTRASRVAGENSTTEPPMRMKRIMKLLSLFIKCFIFKAIQFDKINVIMKYFNFKPEFNAFMKHYLCMMNID